MQFDLLSFTLSCSLPLPIVSCLFFLSLVSFIRAADKSMEKEAIHRNTGTLPVAGPPKKEGQCLENRYGVPRPRAREAHPACLGPMDVGTMLKF